jgi:hypothetical protein
VHLSKDEVITFIRDFIEGSGGDRDWDDFTSIPIDDPALDLVRRECASLPDRFPPTRPGHYCSEQGLDELRRLADGLSSQV